MVTAAAEQASGVGQEIHRLAIFDGHLYAAYGDYDANTGPLNILSTPLGDPGVFTSEQALATEEIWTMRTLSEKLYVPEIDPRGGDDASAGQYAVATASGAWTVHTNVTPTPEHVFAVAERDGSLWLSGAAYDGELSPGLGGVASVWRSDDDGATWTREIAQPSESGGLRVYALAPTTDGLLAFASDHGGPVTVWHRPDGGEWAEADPTGYPDGVSEAVPFLDGALLLAGGYKVLAIGQQMAATPGAGTPLDVLVTDVTVVGSHAYALGTDGTIWRGNGTTWTALFTLDAPTARSLAVTADETTVYLGTTDSRVLSATLT